MIDQNNKHKKKKRHNKLKHNMIYLNNPNLRNTLFNKDINTEINKDNNPEFNQDNNPEFNQDNNPEFNQDNNPEFNQDNNPEFNQDNNPEFNQDINPEFNQDINPEFNQDINPEFNQDINQLYHYSDNNLIINDLKQDSKKLIKKHKINKSITLAELAEINNEQLKYDVPFINLETINNNLKISWNIDYKLITENNDNLKLFISGYDNKYNSSLLVYNLTPALSSIIKYVNLINNNKGELTLNSLSKGYYTLKYTEKYIYECCIGKQINININNDYNKIRLLKVSIKSKNEDCILALFKKEDLTNDLNKSILYLSNKDGVYKNNILYFNIHLKYLSGNYILKYFYLSSITPFFNSYSGYKEINIINEDDIKISYDKTCKMFKIEWSYNSTELTKPNSITNGAYLEISINNKINYEYIFNNQYDNSLNQQGYILTNIFDIIINDDTIIIKLMNVNKFGLFSSCVLIREFKPIFFKLLKKYD